MWAVCSKCGRWNLTPLEERWEAIEECERQFRGTILRTSTDQIGLARVKEGTDLIRIGKPLRPEFAAWRYARHFKRRRRIHNAATAAGIAAMLGVSVVAGINVGFGWLAGGLFVKVATRRNELGRARRFIVRNAESAFGTTILRHESVNLQIIRSDDEQGWALRFAHGARQLDFFGKDAFHTAHLVAPALNAEGATPWALETAVREIEVARSPELYFRRILKSGLWKYINLTDYPDYMRIAFEMAAHEETERAALEGDLAQLEADWREAEEIASIADNMFIPESITRFIKQNRTARNQKPR